MTAGQLTVLTRLKAGERLSAKITGGLVGGFYWREDKSASSAPIGRVSKNVLGELGVAGFIISPCLYSYTSQSRRSGDYREIKITPAGLAALEGK